MPQCKEVIIDRGFKSLGDGKHGTVITVYDKDGNLIVSTDPRHKWSDDDLQNFAHYVREDQSGTDSIGDLFRKWLKEVSAVVILFLLPTLCWSQQPVYVETKDSVIHQVMWQRIEDTGQWLADTMRTDTVPFLRFYVHDSECNGCAHPLVYPPKKRTVLWVRKEE